MIPARRLGPGAFIRCGCPSHVRSGAGEAERIELLKKHREEVRRALASQRECLKLLDAKIEYYADCLARAPQANAL